MNNSTIKVFLDGADRASMLEMTGSPLVQGFTTNPSLMRKAGVKDYGAFCREILPQLKGKPVSFEVFADDFEEMKKQAKIIAAWENSGSSSGAKDQLYVKIPVVNSRGESSERLIRELSHAGIKLNVTAIYTEAQIKSTCDAVQGGAPALVSVFGGRLADAGHDPLPVMRAGAKLCAAAGPQVELLWASTREAYNFIQAAECGCKIITAPLDLIKKAAAFGKTPQELTLETVRTFKSDSEAAGFTLG